MDDVLLRKAEGLALHAIKQQKELEGKENEINGFKPMNQVLTGLPERIENFENSINN